MNLCFLIDNRVSMGRKEYSNLNYIEMEKNGDKLYLKRR